MPVIDPSQAIDLGAIRSTAQMVAGFKTTAGAYQPRPDYMIPVLGISFIMANGEERKSVNVSPELVLPLVATLTQWASAIQDAVAATGFQVDPNASHDVGPMPEASDDLEAGVTWAGNMPDQADQGRGEPSIPAEPIPEGGRVTGLSTAQRPQEGTDESQQ